MRHTWGCPSVQLDLQGRLVCAMAGCDESETWSNRADSGESEVAKPVKVELRAVSGERIAEIEVDCDSSMGQFFAKLRAQRFDSDELKQFKKHGFLVLLTSACLGSGEGMWKMSDMYCRPMNCRCVKAEVDANRPLIFQVILSDASNGINDFGTGRHGRVTITRGRWNSL
jgi:hypothetical protein